MKAAVALPDQSVERADLADIVSSISGTAITPDQATPLFAKLDAQLTEEYTTMKQIEDDKEKERERQRREKESEREEVRKKREKEREKEELKKQKEKEKQKEKTERAKQAREQKEEREKQAEKERRDKLERELRERQVCNFSCLFYDVFSVLSGKARGRVHTGAEGGRGCQGGEAKIQTRRAQTTKARVETEASETPRQQTERNGQ